MIINPLKVWVQNILPVVYDDSLSYLEVVAKINAKTNEIITQTNENTNAIETLAEVIAELGDIDELKELLDEVKAVIEDLYSTDSPEMDGTASAGSADHAARSDHVHPTDTTRAPTSHSSTTDTYGVSTTTKYGHVKLTNSIDNTNDGTAIAPSAVKTVANKVDTYPRPNLLDNWYFGTGVINQHNNESVNGDRKYIIDRWKTIGYQAAQISIDDPGLSIVNNSNGVQSVRQYFEAPLLPGPYTLSAIIVSVTGSNQIGTLTARSASAAKVSESYSTTGLAVLQFTSDEADPVTNIGITCGSGKSVTVLAMKLERGNSQSLAHLENGNPVLNELPNFGDELLKCQRYFQKFKSDTFRPEWRYDYRPMMVENKQTSATNIDKPTLGTIMNGDDVDYYTASVET